MAIVDRSQKIHDMALKIAEKYLGPSDVDYEKYASHFLEIYLSAQCAIERDYNGAEKRIREKINPLPEESQDALKRVADAMTD